MVQGAVPSPNFVPRVWETHTPYLTLCLTPAFLTVCTKEESMAILSPKPEIGTGVYQIPHNTAERGLRGMEECEPAHSVHFQRRELEAHQSLWPSP